ncbi:NAD(P)H-flavin reductase [Candidatus Westeberhardia cardiocondylae]|uniref:NAD(P)H-flavin reductase n=1 Tax=Candidatus Westeberhardia cardiocondylae TaxID=1594731 RepID=A0A0H5BX05_9ENTR|nr:NAD(P)H-flavin reductase [Candidatus Westeberhardia cardiocondylae]CEN32262.1 NAD(P)H-flavin reductase [Candidatus Westeberhardia cardiocondylae]
MRFFCKLFSIDIVANNIYKIRLIPEKILHFFAGQYLFIIMNKESIRPFSLASIPMEHRFIELHMKSFKKNDKYVIRVIQHIRSGRDILIDAPNGKAWLRYNTNRPIILIAGGIGFSYVHSILLTVLKYQPNRKIIIYWGVKKWYHLYNLKELKKLVLINSQLFFIPVVKTFDEYWKGRFGNLLNIIIQDFHTLNPYDIYISGKFEIAMSARYRFCNERDAKEDRIFSDAFSFYELNY